MLLHNPPPHETKAFTAEHTEGTIESLKLNLEQSLRPLR